MNTQIQKLADQANAWCPEGYPSSEGGDAAWKNLVIFEKEDLEKFAELILEEVMQELLINGYEDAFDFLNKHFGVEE